MTGGGLDATADTSPGQQATAPAVEFSYRPQAMHAAGVLAFITALYVLEPQSVQLLAATAPGTLLYVPGRHALTRPRAQKKPVGHSSEVPEREPAGQTYPAPHTPLHVGDCSPDAAPYVPKGHESRTPPTQ